MGKSAPKIVINEYQMSMQLHLCHGPIDVLRRINIGGKTAWEGNLTFPGDVADFTINQPGLFGGEKKEGGPVGDVRAYSGADSPYLLVTDGLAARKGRTAARLPQDYGISWLWLVGRGSINGGNAGFVWGTNTPYLKPIDVRLTSIPRDLDAGTATMPDPTTANPAHIIFACLTNTDWGMGEPPSSIDMASFIEAATTLQSEGFGLSMMWSQPTAIEDFIRDVLDHIQAVVFPHPRTGLHTIKLIRDDYDEATLPIMTDDSMRITNFQRKTWGESINEVVVTWTNPVNDEEEVVSLQDLALIEVQGGIASSARNFYGITNADLAMQVCARELRVAASPLASFDIEADRSWSDRILPGSVLKISSVERGIVEQVVRVGKVDYGRIGDSKIRFDAMEDVFALPASAYVTPPSTEWVDPSQPPTPVDDMRIMTLPAYFAALTASEYALAVSEYPQALVGALTSTTNPDASAYDTWAQLPNTTGSATWTEIGRRSFSGKGVLTAPLVEQDVSIIDLGTGYTTPSQGMQPEYAGFAFLIGPSQPIEQGEFVLLWDVDGGTLTLQRGVLDTTPKAWPTGTEIWFMSADSAWTESTIFSVGDTARFRAAMVTSMGVYDQALAAQFSAPVTDRAWAPLRPAAVRVGGVSFGTYNHVGAGDIGVDWANRNRLTEDTQVMLWSDGSVLPEENQTTTIEILDLAQNVIHTHSGLTGTNFAVPVTSFGAETEGFIRVMASRDGFDSIQGHAIRVTLTP